MNNLELAKEIGLTKEELEQIILDRELFMKLFPLFDSMSQRGKLATVETLFMYLVKEE